MFPVALLNLCHKQLRKTKVRDHPTTQADNLWFLANDSVAKLSKGWCKPISSAAKYSVLLPSYRGTLAKTVSKHLGMLVLRDSAELPRGQLSVRNTQTCVNTLGSRMAARNSQRQKKTKTKQTNPELIHFPIRRVGAELLKGC